MKGGNVQMAVSGKTFQTGSNTKTEVHLSSLIIKPAQSVRHLPARVPCRRAPGASTV